VTREHIYFVPIVFALGVVLGSLLTRHRMSRLASKRFDEEPGVPPPRTTARSLWFPLGVFLLLFAVTHVFGTHGGARNVEDALEGQAIFDQRASFSASEVYARVERFGAAGREAYKRMTFTSDLVFPLALLVFLLQLTRYVGERAPGVPSVVKTALWFFPVAWFLADLIENWTVFQLLDQFPVRDDALASRLGALTHVKFGLLLASVGSLAALSLYCRLGTRRVP
jgi:hypothetical protein